MNSIIVTIAPEHDKTRVLMAREHQDLMKAILPAAHLAHPRAARTLLEGLALFYQQRLSVALLVDASDRSSDAISALCDSLGYGERTVHYEVAVVGTGRRRIQRRIPGIGNFQDLRQLHLKGVDR